MPKGAAPAGREVGDEASSVRSPPFTVSPVTAFDPSSTTQSVAPSGASRASNAPLPLNGVLPSKVSVPSAAIEYREIVLLAVLTVKRYWPSWLISTQQGAVCKSANGEDPIDDGTPLSATLKAETEPLPAPPWAFETKSCVRWVGLNSLPNGPGPWAANGEPGAAVSRPDDATVKLSISEGPTRVPTRRLPSPLNRTSPGDEPSGSGNVESASGARCPPALSVKPV